MLRPIPIFLALACMVSVACVAPTYVNEATVTLPSPTATPSPDVLAGLTFDIPSREHVVAISAAETFGFTNMSLRAYIRPANVIAHYIDSGNYNFEYFFPRAFGDDKVVASVKTAALPAANGNNEQYVETTIRPIVRAWAADAALETSYMTSPMAGPGVDPYPNPTPGPEAYATEAGILKLVGWPLVYTSASRLEVMYVYGESGVMLRLRWHPKDLDESTVRVSKQAAADLLSTAMRDPASMSEEERTGRDYFLGTPYVGLFPPPTANVWDHLKPVYDFPANAFWEASLGYEYAEKPVWYIRGGFGSGLVDAQTGALIRFYRPSQNSAGNSGLVSPTPFAPTAAR